MADSGPPVDDALRSRRGTCSSDDGMTFPKEDREAAVALLFYEEGIIRCYRPVPVKRFEAVIIAEFALLAVLTGFGLWRLIGDIPCQVYEDTGPCLNRIAPILVGTLILLIGAWSRVFV